MTAPEGRHRNPFHGLPCGECGYPALVLEMRAETRLTARPLGSHSLAGAQLKVSAVAASVSWPWCVCRHCGRESRGKE